MPVAHYTKMIQPSEYHKQQISYLNWDGLVEQAECFFLMHDYACILETRQFAVGHKQITVRNKYHQILLRYTQILDNVQTSGENIQPDNHE